MMIIILHLSNFYGVVMLTYMLWYGQAVDRTASVVTGTLYPRSIGVAQ